VGAEEGSGEPSALPPKFTLLLLLERRKAEKTAVEKAAVGWEVE